MSKKQSRRFVPIALCFLDLKTNFSWYLSLVTINIEFVAFACSKKAFDLCSFYLLRAGAVQLPLHQPKI